MKSEHGPPQTLETIQSFCLGMGIGLTSFYKHVRLQNISIIKIGKRTLVRTSEREDFLERLATTQTGKGAT